ncbi:hypothetical protein BCT94_10340 [Vibrio breoganii]|nr:hypothetical protein BCV08_07845 [Vibrio breoganii]PMH11996.1 hypothetical protein BCU74_18045 [Vibrio breoganii]PMJ45556.1 hypothetical protein BCU21_13170 [Vibrio breoganii]PMK52055.1 hypothetical protein BCT98_15740 [Vibrio breoganii]PMK54888.1 hypothetical protein BCT97_13940 [Vibrio breoganii]
MTKKLSITVSEKLYLPLKLGLLAVLIVFSFYTYEVFERGYLVLNGEVVSRESHSSRFYSRLFLEKGIGLLLVAWVVMFGVQKQR